jgi:hypothetical protein
MTVKPKNEARIFLHHFFRNLVIGTTVLFSILLIGIIGYRHFEQTNWIDSYANAALIVSGVGQLSEPKTDQGKLFIATYSLLGGASFLLVVGIVFAPIFHWVFRQVKVEDRDHFKKE